MKRLNKNEKLYDKLKNHVILRTDKMLSPMLPETTILNEENDFWPILEKYRHVIMKPTFGSLGTDIIEVFINDIDQYEVHHESETVSFKKKKELFVFLKNQVKSNPYIVQQYIPFTSIEDQPFDLRVNVQRRKNKLIWNVTERYVEVGTEVMTINQAVERSYLRELNTDKLLVDIDHTAVQVAQKLRDFSPHKRMWGLDLRIDVDGNIWITEIHSKPAKLKGNKQLMHTILKTDEYLSPLIPETTKFDEENDLWSFLDKYRHVILKPTSGSLGTGIIKISKNDIDHYEVQHRDETRSFKKRKQLYLFVKNKMKAKPYIVQQYIQFGSINNQPFDLRVIVQRKRNELEWKVTGKYAKVAHEGFFITNLAKKGKVLTVTKAINRSNLVETNRVELLKEINKAALLVAHKLHDFSPRQRIWGLDMAFDSSGKVWIIEANSKPGIIGFKRLKNRNMYKTILKYKRAK